ncbi:hypothetical protein WK27_02930 [Burkholderia vietnamiensis]|nr:PelD GGDEF domain-containing protein [Burkholderia vietnamiensis]KVF35299.1 hypothetical protein WJ09_11085 [Burkholderia vietnamiensis]KVF46349.1 hypothetical protein WJ10_05250 [Burkholderia vietnamiensis]KVR93211.1 hypothetical protein WK27_02930 [Burkholderia vietnamiensis]
MKVRAPLGTRPRGKEKCCRDLFASIRFPADRSTSHRSIPSIFTRQWAFIDGYLARIEASLRAQFDADLEGTRIGVHTLHLDNGDPGPTRARLLKRAGGLMHTVASESLFSGWDQAKKRYVAVPERPRMAARAGAHDT